MMVMDTSSPVTLFLACCFFGFSTSVSEAWNPCAGLPAGTGNVALTDDKCATEYAACQSYTYWPRACPLGQTFSPETQACQPLHNITECACAAGQSTAAVNECSAEYLECDNNHVVGRAQCDDDGSVYDRTIGACRPRHLVPDCECAAQSEGDTAIGTDCLGQYIRCRNGSSELITCGVGQVYVSAIESCRLESLAKLGACPCAGVASGFRHKHYVSPFYDVCEGGLVVAEGRCAPGQLFNRTTNQCTPVTPTAIHELLSAPTVCPPDVPAWSVGQQPECSRSYVQCAQGGRPAVARECPPAQVFDTALEQCAPVADVAGCSQTDLNDDS